jgi:hypothetical protein
MADGKYQCWVATRSAPGEEFPVLVTKNCIQDETDYQKQDSSFCKNWTQSWILNKIAAGASH